MRVVHIPPLDAQSAGGLFDKETQAYASWSGSAGGRQYLDLGYAAIDAAYPGDGGAGKTLEYAYQDWTLAQLARQLGKKGLNASQFADVTVSSQYDNITYAAAGAVDGRPIRSPGNGQ
jgi:putative alpha-1,2-mannosidase